MNGMTHSGPNDAVKGSLREKMASGSFYSLVAILTGQTFALATSIIYARLLGRDDLGILAIFMQIGNVASAAATLSLGTATTRFIAKLRQEDRGKLGPFVSTTLAITLLSSVAASVALFLGAGYLGLTLYREPELVPMIQITALFLPLAALAGFGSSVLQGLQSIRKLAILGVALEAMGVPVTYFSLLRFGLIGAAIGGGLTTVVSFALIFGSARTSLSREGFVLRLALHAPNADGLLRYAVPLIISSIAIRTALLYQGSFLALSLGFGDAGLFKVASTLYRVVSFVPAAVTIPLLPLVSELQATSTRERTRESLSTIVRITTFIGSPISLIVGLAASPVILILYGSDFLAAAPLAFVLAVTGFVETIDAVSVSSVLGEGKTGLLLRLDLFHAFLIATTTTAFVTWFGLIGIGYALFVTATVHATLLLVFLSATDRLDATRVLRALGVVAACFGLAGFGVAYANAQQNAVLIAGLLLFTAVAGLLFMEAKEREILASILRTRLRMLRS